MPIRNSILDEVQYQVSRYLSQHGEALACSCQRCQDDVVALAASQLPTRYSTSFQGHFLIGVELQSKQVQLDILQAILTAIETVNRSPRHDPNRGVCL
ncbi:MAG: late competence development ComFB family protein [Firmicutes bacterium]|nr:late competence development ComFB family protein [Bacillota bacterium]